jgi:hypothetical protein
MPTPSEYRAEDLHRLADEHGTTVETFWTEHDDMIGDILHARTADGCEWRRLPFVDAQWEEVFPPAPEGLDKLWCMHVHTKHEDQFELFTSPKQAMRWLAAWVHNNRYDEMDEHDEYDHELFEENWEAKQYSDCVELWFGNNLDEYYYLSEAQVHDYNEKIELEY